MALFNANPAFTLATPVSVRSQYSRRICLLRTPRIGALRLKSFPSATAAGGTNRENSAVLEPVELVSSENGASSNSVSEALDRPENQGPITKLRTILSPQPVDRKIAAIALPTLGALSIDPIVALADMACVGHLGAVALASVAVANNVFNMSFTCFNFLGMATTPAIARAFGRSDEEEASRLIAQALWVAAIIGLVASTLLGIYARPLVQFFGATTETIPHSVAYLRARIFAAPFLLSSMVCNGAFRGFQDTKSVFFVSITANLCNLILFPTLIFGAKLGVVGAGIATTFGQVVAGSIMFTMLVRMQRLRLEDLRRPPALKKVVPLLRTGAVLSVRTLSIFSTISYATATAAQLGTVQVAAFEIGRQLYALFARLLDAIAVAAQALVALILGQNEPLKARDAANRILQMGFVLGSIFFLLLMGTAGTLPRLFTSDPLVAATIAATFPIMAVIQPVNGLVFTLDGIFTAGRKFTFLSVAIFVAASISSAVLLFVRNTQLPLTAVWCGLNVMMVFRASFLFAGYNSRWSPVLPKRFMCSIQPVQQKP